MIHRIIVFLLRQKKCPIFAPVSCVRPDQPIVGMTKAFDPSPPPSGQRAVTVLTLVQNLTPSMRSEEHTSELQSLMRISYAVFCLKKKKPRIKRTTYYTLS